jgi:hypothetical protein
MKDPTRAALEVRPQDGHGAPALGGHSRFQISDFRDERPDEGSRETRREAARIHAPGAQAAGGDSRSKISGQWK